MNGKVRPTKDYIIANIQSSLMILNDVNSFIFLRSKSMLPIFKHYRLGGGNLLSIMGQFSVLNFIAKVHFVLQKGEKAYFNKKDVDEFENVKEIKRNIDKRLIKYFREPRLGEINEKEAFVSLILNYPVDLGLSKDKEKIEKNWDEIRNKISHVATLGVNHAAVATEYLDFEYPEIIERAKEWKNMRAVFRPLDPQDRLRIRNEIRVDDPKLKKPSSKLRWIGSKDMISVDDLNWSIIDIVEWIINNINNDMYDLNFLLETKKWIEIQFQSKE